MKRSDFLKRLSGLVALSFLPNVVEEKEGSIEKEVVDIQEFSRNPFEGVYYVGHYQDVESIYASGFQPINGDIAQVGAWGDLYISQNGEWIKLAKC